MVERLRVGYEPDFAPLTFVEDGTARGMIVDILNRVFDRSGCVVDFVPVALPDQDEAVRAGEVDAIAFKAAIPERADFSTPLAASGAAWFGQAEIPSDGRPAPGTRLATPGAGPLLADLRRRYPDIVYIDVDTYAQALAAVVDGAADCAALNFHVGCYLAVRDHAGLFALPEAPFQKLPLALAFAKGAHACLLGQLNAGLSELREDGTLSEVESRWTGLRGPRPLQQ